MFHQQICPHCGNRRNECIWPCESYAHNRKTACRNCGRENCDQCIIAESLTDADVVEAIKAAPWERRTPEE